MFVELANGPLVSRSFHDNKFVEAWRRYKMAGNAVKLKLAPFAAEVRLICKITV
jgi:hypothetical protein